MEVDAIRKTSSEISLSKNKEPNLVEVGFSIKRLRVAARITIAPFQALIGLFDVSTFRSLFDLPMWLLIH